MLERIKEIVNIWDPIGFFPMAPEDEYFSEIEKIYRFIFSTTHINVLVLAEKINEIFVESFGKDIYNENINQCIMIAEQILKT